MGGGMIGFAATGADAGGGGATTAGVGACTMGGDTTGFAATVGDTGRGGTAAAGAVAGAVDGAGK